MNNRTLIKCSVLLTPLIQRKGVDTYFSLFNLLPGIPVLTVMRGTLGSSLDSLHSNMLGGFRLETLHWDKSLIIIIHLV